MLGLVYVLAWSGLHLVWPGFMLAESGLLCSGSGLRLAWSDSLLAGPGLRLVWLGLILARSALRVAAVPGAGVEPRWSIARGCRGGSVIGFVSAAIAQLVMPTPIVPLG